MECKTFAVGGWELAKLGKLGFHVQNRPKKILAQKSDKS